MDRPYRRIVEDAEVPQALQRLEHGGGPFGLDTETTGLDPLRDRLRLVQIAAAEGPVFLFDQFHLGPDSQRRIGEFLAAAGPFILQNAPFDLSFLGRQLGAVPVDIRDTMLLSQYQSGGEPCSHSLQQLVHRHLGLELDKSEQTSDFAGELTESQLAYAARDAALLLPLYQRLAHAGEPPAYRAHVRLWPALLRQEPWPLEAGDAEAGAWEVGGIYLAAAPGPVVPRFSGLQRGMFARAFPALGQAGPGHPLWSRWRGGPVFRVGRRFAGEGFQRLLTWSGEEGLREEEAARRWLLQEAGRSLPGPNERLLVRALLLGAPREEWLRLAAATGLPPLQAAGMRKAFYGTFPVHARFLAERFGEVREAGGVLLPSGRRLWTGDRCLLPAALQKALSALLFDDLLEAAEVLLQRLPVQPLWLGPEGLLLIGEEGIGPAVRAALGRSALFGVWRLDTPPESAFSGRISLVRPE